MTSTVVRAPAELPPFREAFARVRAEFEVPAAFPAAVEAEAAAIVRHGPATLPGTATSERFDARHLPFVTIDPLGSRDLDQAFHAERRGDGFRVWYAIADVAAFVTPGSATDRESIARGVTLYLPDGRAPMLPEEICEGVASLLPGEERPAILWTLDLDATGVCTSARVERATIRSRTALDYPSVQASLDAGRADAPLVVLSEVGTLRRALEAERGGFSLDLPSQEVVPRTDGSFDLRYEAPLPVEGCNAQISLLTGMEAAKIMIEARLGIVRTLLPPEPAQLDRLRNTARALGVSWRDGALWGDVVRNLDRSTPKDAAFLVQAAHLLRGAGYVALDAQNTVDPAAVPVHAGVAAPYAHVTAPLRRLADRYANEIVLADCAGVQPPDWARAALDGLVATMQAANHRSAGVDHAIVDAVECAVLAAHLGETFDGIVVDRHEHGVVVQLRQPAVVASLAAQVTLGTAVTVTVVAVDPLARHITLALA